MKNLKPLPAVLCMVVVVACFRISVSGQSAEDKNKLAAISASGLSVRWDVAAPYSAATLTISAPDGRVFSKEFRPGTSPEFTLTDNQAERLPDGVYTYELRLSPVLSPALKETLKAARGKDDDPESDRAERKRPVLPPSVQSGSFSIVNGQTIVAGAVEEVRRTATKTELPRPRGMISGNTITRLRNHRLSLSAMPDIVTPDDEIIQGSLCVGLDCVNNESFGFDTIRLKENNTRIKFDDTSTSPGFPANDWQLTANDSSSGGANKFSIEDVTNSKTPFTITAGAPTNSIFLASSGKVGFGSNSPVLNLNITATDTPAIRQEQTSGGGFTAQTWDIGANEANWFVRDVTGGSRLPFRIRPGAPTSSIDINASGNVGVGTASPELRLDARVGNTTTDFSNNTTYAGGFGNVSGKRVTIGYDETGEDIGLIQSVQTGVGFKNLSLNPNGGNVGVGTVAPTALLSVNGTANKPGGGSWDVFSDERLKNIRGRFNGGLRAVMQLQPLRYEYKRNNALGIKSEGEHIGFGAQAVQKIIPEAVTRNSAGYLMVNNDPIIWTMLNAIKEQQQEIAQLRGQVRKLEAASHRRRK